MNKQITSEILNKFSKNYSLNFTNKIIENAITTNGLEKTCIDNSVIVENQPVFNIEKENVHMHLFKMIMEMLL